MSLETTPLPDSEIEHRLDALEARFQQWLHSLPGDMPTVAADSLDRMRIRPDRPRSWTRRLSPLVVLYPSLQAAALVVTAQRRDRVPESLALAHLQLLAHAFLSDRELDGQMELRPEEIVLSTQALLAAVSTLGRASEDADTLGRLELLMSRHYRAQLISYPPLHQERDESERTAFRIVADRALPGWLATEILLDAEPRWRRRVRLAFDHLAVGLQWTDDLLDWTQDLRKGQENLLLHRLGSETDRLGTVDELRVETRLLESGIYDLAFERIDLHLGRAIELQRQLGGSTIVHLVTELVEKFARLRGQLAVLTTGASDAKRPTGR